MTTLTGQKIRPSDRISFTLLLAIALHALVILGFSFQFIQDQTKRSSTIEIILNPVADQQRNEDALYLANSDNQQQHAVTQGSVQLSQSQQEQSTTAANKKTSHAFQLQTNSGEQSEQAPITTETEQISEQTQAQDINTLMSELNLAKLAYAQRPKLHFFDSVSSKSVLEADYVRLWVERIEQQGNLYYPLHAIEQGLSGTLIMSVVIASDGRLISSKIIGSSGNLILDQAAHQVVEHSQPFRAFPQAMQSQYDQLMITRTWVYQSDQTFTTEEKYD
jgi:periplasmic protein TonB